jgi:hypothetical protein
VGPSKKNKKENDSRFFHDVEVSGAAEAQFESSAGHRGHRGRCSATRGSCRLYGSKDIERLGRICLYRSAELKFSDIRSLLEETSGDAASVLTRRLAELRVEIGTGRRDWWRKWGSNPHVQ